MVARWVSIASVPVVFVIGMLAAADPDLAITGMAICIVAIIIRVRFRRFHSGDLSVASLRPDLILLAFPSTLALRIFIGQRPYLLVIGILIAATFIRKPDARFRVEFGPLLLLFASAIIVFSQPENIYQLLTFLLLVTLVVRLVMTVDARRIIASLIDGCGLYLLVNVVGYAAGLRSFAEQARIGGLVESTGFIRIIYPLSVSINIPPVIAALYIVAFVFMIAERGWLRRALRLICLVAAIIVLLGAGTRAPLIIAFLLLMAGLSFPSITRWIGQAAALLAAVSVILLPILVSNLRVLFLPIVALQTGRITTTKSIETMEGRVYVWDPAIKYWSEWVTDLPHVLFGYGVGGQYRSGASLSYSELLSTIIRNPERAAVHNSFLQQVFDGGLVGWLLLALAVFWASMRLSSRRRAWGMWGSSAIVALTVLLLSSSTEVSLAPGFSLETFWLLVVIVGVACQAESRSEVSNPSTGRYQTRQPSQTARAGNT